MRSLQQREVEAGTKQNAKEKKKKKNRNNTEPSPTRKEKINNTQ